MEICSLVVSCNSYGWGFLGLLQKVFERGFIHVIAYAAWDDMHEILILLHIRAMNFRAKFLEISDHMSELKFYCIETQILLYFSDQSLSMTSLCSKIYS